MTAFNYKKWERWNVGFDTSNTVLWNYTDRTSTFAEITAAGYFDVVNIVPSSPQITPDDLIYIVASDNAQICMVDSINPIVINIFNPFPTAVEGSIIYYDGENWVPLPPSATPGDVLTSGGPGAPPAWATASSGGASIGAIYPIIIGQFTS